MKSDCSVQSPVLDSVYFFILFDCFMGFDNLVKVFECSLVTNSMSKMFGFSTVSSS